MSLCPVPAVLYRRILRSAILLLAFAASSAWAVDCSEFPNGTIDGFAGDIPPSQLQIDRNCTIRNFPADNPLSTNFSFLTQPGQTEERWLIVFDNVVHVGRITSYNVCYTKLLRSPGRTVPAWSAGT